MKELFMSTWKIKWWRRCVWCLIGIDCKAWFWTRCQERNWEYFQRSRLTSSWSNEWMVEIEFHIRGLYPTLSVEGDSYVFIYPNVSYVYQRVEKTIVRGTLFLDSTRISPARCPRWTVKSPIPLVYVATQSSTRIVTWQWCVTDMDIDMEFL